MSTILRNFDFRSLYMLYRFLTSLDKETKKSFHPPLVHPLTNPLSLICYTRLLLSIIIPMDVLFKTLPMAAYITVAAKSNCSIIGFAYLTVRRSSNSSYESRLGIVVDTEFRNKGIGQRLLKILIDKAMVIGINKITVRVLKENLGAINFYRKHGFRTAKETGKWKMMYAIC